MAVPAPSQDVVRRNRAKVLQRAAEMREGKGRSQERRIWSVPLRRALVTFMVVLTLFVSGTGLVGAASNTLPGDNLYPVKRTWEGIRLFFTFDLLEREALELEHENERLEELYELFAEGRSAEVDFSGYVTRHNGNEWRVSGVTVLLSTDTRLPDQPVTIGAAVRVRGWTQGDQIVHAERIELLPAGAKLPEVEDDDDSEIEEENNGNSNQSIEEDSGGESDDETPKVEATKVPEPESEPESESIDGVVSSIKNNLIVINGITMDLSLAEDIKGTPGVGVVADVEGYYDANGVFIVIKIEFKNESSGDDEGGSNSNDDNDDGNDGNSNDNDNSDDDDGDDGDNSSSDDGGDDNGDDGDNSNDSDDDD
jgi:hypothetical protein